MTTLYIMTVLFLSPFIAAPFQNIDELQNIQIIINQYPVINYREQEYIPFEMKRITYVSVNCQSMLKTINYEYTQNMTTGVVLNSSNVSKTFSVDYLPVCQK